MFRFLVTICCCLLLLVEAKKPVTISKTENLRAQFDKVIKNQNHIQTLIGNNIVVQQEQNSKQLQRFLPDTENFLHDILQSFKKLTISMRDQFQNAANHLQPLINQEYDIQQLEIQKYVRDFLQEVLDGINFHTKFCLAREKPDTSDECAQQQQWPNSCQEVETKRDGLTRIYFQGVSYLVFCDQKTLEGGWMVVLHRSSPAKNFQNTWYLHKYGFGTFCESDFFVGLRTLHQLTAARKHELLIEVTDKKKMMTYARYDEIVIGDEHSGYQFMVLGNYNGTAGDSLRYVVGRKFATIEHDIDDCVRKYNATGWLMGGSECSVGNIFGNILTTKTYHKQSALMWPSFRSLGVLTELRMLIRVA